MARSCLPLSLAAALLLGLAVPVQAQGSVQASPPVSRTGQPTLFRLHPIPSGPGLEFAWSFGDGTARTPFSADAEMRHAYARAGHYSIVVTARDSSGVATHQLLHAVVNLPTPRPPARSSSLLLDSTRRRLWAANSDNHSVACLDAGTFSSRPSAPAGAGRPALLFEAPVGRNPRTLAQAGDGAVWVADQDDASLHVLDPETGRTLDVIRLPYASRPYGIAFDPARSTAYVTLEARGELLAIDAASRRPKATLAVGPSPRGLAVTWDGSSAVVTRFLSPADRGEAVLVDLAAFRVRTAIPLLAQAGDDGEGHGRGVPNYLQSVAISPDGRSAWIPAKKDNTARGKARDGLALNFQNTVRAMALRVDLETGAEDRDARLDFDNSDLAHAAAFDTEGQWLFVSLQGNHQVAVVDPHAAGSVVARIDSTGHSPQGLLVDGRDSLLYVHNFLSRTVSAFDISGLLSGRRLSRPPRRAEVRTVLRENLDPRVLAGKRIFHDSRDARMSKDNYLSCASCHLEGGSDVRIWDFTDRGEGLRKTTSLLGRAGMAHGPVHWSANFDEIQDFEHDMRGPFGGTGFLGAAMGSGAGTPLGAPKAGLDPDLDALAAYVSSLDRVHASPFRDSSGSLTREALAGKALFERADVGCALCHAGPRFTDSRLPGLSRPAPGPVAIYPGASSLYTAQGFLLHDVGTLKPASGSRLGDTLPGLDTPTLKGIWEFPPYLHDGSAPTLMDVITRANPQDRHGKTSHLTQTERSQLVAYLQQLDEDPPERGASSLRPLHGQARSPRAERRRLHGYPGLIVLELPSGPGGPPPVLRMDGRAAFSVDGFSRREHRSSRD